MNFECPCCGFPQLCVEKRRELPSLFGGYTLVDSTERRVCSHCMSVFTFTAIAEKDKYVRVVFENVVRSDIVTHVYSHVCSGCVKTCKLKSDVEPSCCLTGNCVPRWEKL